MMRMRRSQSHHFPLAIARGETEVVQKLLQRQLSSSSSSSLSTSISSSKTFQDFSYVGHTYFGTTITYEISPLGLAVAFRRWAVFQALLDAGMDPNAEQKLLLAADRRSARHYVAQFSSALELFLFAAVRPTYFPPATPDTEFLSVLCKLVEVGAEMSVRGPFLRRLCAAVCLDLWLHVWRTETSTGIARQAAALLRCLVSHGLSAPGNLFLDYHTLDDNLYLVLLSCLNREINGSDEKPLLPRPKLRATVVLLLNLLLSSRVALPGQAAIERAPKLVPASPKPRDIFSTHETFRGVFVTRPMKLGLLARREVRRMCGGRHFQQRIERLPLISDQQRRYVAYLEEVDLKDEMEELFREKR